MNDKQILRFLLSMFNGCTYAEMFGVVDGRTGIRQAGVRIVKLKDYPNGEEDYRVTINKDILNKQFVGKI